MSALLCLLAFIHLLRVVFRGRRRSIEIAKARENAVVLYEKNGITYVSTKQGRLNCKAQDIEDFVLKGKSIGMADENMWKEL